MLPSGTNQITLSPNENLKVPFSRSFDEISSFVKVKDAFRFIRMLYFPVCPSNSISASILHRIPSILIRFIFTISASLSFL